MIKYGIKPTFERREIMSYIIDRYKLNLYCRCMECKKRNHEGNVHSCKAYPKTNGIPPKVWNEENAECEHFEPKNHEED